MRTIDSTDPNDRDRHRTYADWILIALAFVTMLGCGSKGLPSKIVFGSVVCGGEKVANGQVVFMPIEGAPGANCAGRIADGQYRIDARGGVPLGKHRVCVDAKRKTGRKVQSTNGRETTLVDEEVRVGPEIYAGNQSPLIVDIKADSDGRCDIVIPGQ